MLPGNFWGSLVDSISLQDTKLIYRNLWHFYTQTKENIRTEIKETIPFTITSKKKNKKQKKTTLDETYLRR